MLKCWGVGGNLELKYTQLTVFQFKDHPRPLWLAVSNEHYVLADDYSCKFSGKATWRWRVVPLDPHQPQCTCIGNQCTPPGCRK